MAGSTSSRRRELRFPDRRPALSPPRRIARAALAVATTPIAIAAASALGAPGMGLRMHCARLGARALAGGAVRRAYDLTINPMDSFRYFEIDFVRRQAPRDIGRYLDVSSPRLIPLTILEDRAGLVGDIINPIQDDLDETVALATVLGLSNACCGQATLLETADFPEQSFDLITSVSVVEHIPDDKNAIQSMWRLLRPGGMLLLTMPCAQLGSDEYTNIDEYGLIAPASDGLVFWQRYYDEESLASRVFAITGMPSHQEIFGEVRPGLYDRNVLRKRTDPTYPFWWEPVILAKEFRRFGGISDLPGMGVIAMRFDKGSA